MLNIKQMENENLIYYVKRFKQARDILMSHIGSKVLDQFIETTPEHRAAIDDMDLPRATELKADVFGRWMAFLLLKNSDRSKYRSLLNGLTSQYSMDNNQYLKTIMAASDILAYINMTQSPRGRTDQDKPRRMMKEAQAVPITRPASRKAERRNSATAAEKRGISALIVQRRRTFRETNGLFVKLSYICRRSKVSRMKTVHLKLMMTRRPNERSTNKPHE